MIIRASLPPSHSESILKGILLAFHKVPGADRVGTPDLEITELARGSTVFTIDVEAGCFAFISDQATQADYDKYSQKFVKKFGENLSEYIRLIELPYRVEMRSGGKSIGQCIPPERLLKKAS